MEPWSQAFGVVLMLAVLVDVILTVLYARAGTGIFSHRLARVTWRVFRLLPVGRHRPAVLSFCGPAILVLLVLAWSAFLALGAGSLIKTALDDDRASWMKRSVAVQELWTLSLMLVSTLDRTFLDPAPFEGGGPADDMAGPWRARYVLAVRRLRQAGVPLGPCEEKGAESYVELRRQWEPLIAMLAPAMAYGMEEIDPVGSSAR